MLGGALRGKAEEQRTQVVEWSEVVAPQIIVRPQERWAQIVSAPQECWIFPPEIECSQERWKQAQERRFAPEITVSRCTCETRSIGRGFAGGRAWRARGRQRNGVRSGQVLVQRRFDSRFTRGCRAS